jgi:thiol-disulfide isomerase/thioredoxin
MYIKVVDQKSADNFNTSVKKGYWVVLYYANWCPHCQVMKPEWNKLSEKFKQDKSINVADVESEFMDKIDQEHKQNVQGFPSIVSCNQGKKIADFTGSRTYEEMNKFANDNNTSKPTPINNNINNLLRKITKSKKSKTTRSRKMKKTKKSKKTKSKKTRKH